MDNVLILGANGLVGSSFDYGIKLGKEEVDLLDYKKTLEVIEYYKPTAIINCAGQVGGVKANMDNKFDFFKNNMLINMNVIEASMKAGVPNLISFLSTCIFPNDLSNSDKFSDCLVLFLCFMSWKREVIEKIATYISDTKKRYYEN